MSHHKYYFKVTTITHTISKATTPEKDANSGFENTDLDAILHSQCTQRLFIGGVATEIVYEYCQDALHKDYQVLVLGDAIRAINLKQNDNLQAIFLVLYKHWPASLMLKLCKRKFSSGI